MALHHRFLAAALGSTLILVITQAQATVVTIKVTVVAPPCIINGSNPITVNFGKDIMTTRVDGSNYTQPVKYTFSCSGQSKNAMKLQIKGSGATFDSEVLATNQKSLGIKLLNNNQPMPLNTWVNFTYPTLPALTAVPVQESGATLLAGTLNASATMMVDYQ